jgi:ring-1,2-phenylacetyl-CoA epoxidase subunit PaaA
MTVIFTDDVDVAEVDKLPGQYRGLFVHQMVANGEGELSAGDTYVDSFYPVAPNPDERYKCLQFGMEVDHFRYFAHARTHKLI